MSDMKCPVCNVGYVHESVNHWCCDYEFCPSYDETDTETYDILIRTRKALDKAKWWLKEIVESHRCTPISTAEMALKEITAEQKKSKTVHNKIEFPEYNDGLLEEFDKQFFENGQDDDLTETALEQKDK